MAGDTRQSSLECFSWLNQGQDRLRTGGQIEGKICKSYTAGRGPWCRGVLATGVVLHRGKIKRGIRARERDETAWRERASGRGSISLAYLVTVEIAIAIDIGRLFENEGRESIPGPEGIAIRGVSGARSALPSVRSRIFKITGIPKPFFRRESNIIPVYVDENGNFFPVNSSQVEFRAWRSNSITRIRRCEICIKSCTSE